MSETSIVTAFEGAAFLYATGFQRLLAIAQPVEERPFTHGIWQHFPHRRKWYRTTDEFYVVQGNPEAVLSAIDITGCGPCRTIDVIGSDPSAEDRLYRSAGYELDSVEILMDRPITALDAKGPIDPRIIHILASNQIERLANLWNWGRTANDYQPTLPAHNSAPGLVQAYIEIEEEPAAYGRAIVWNDVAFLSDVNAFPGFRRRGLGRAIMQALHTGLARAGAQRVVLTATEMGVPLYEQLGYRTLAHDWIYESTGCVRTEE